MADWTTITPGGRIALGTVSIACRQDDQPFITVAADVLEGFGDATHVVSLRNGSPGMVGLRAAKRGPGVHSMKLLGKNPRGTAAASVSATGILTAIGKAHPTERMLLEHRWDGDVLVLDLSGLPDAPGGR